MEQKIELGMIKGFFILMIFVLVGMFVVWEVLYSSEPAKNMDLGTKIVVSGFGNIDLFNPEKENLLSANVYKDIQLGFQISKISDDWEIHSALDELSSNELTSLQAKGFIDGIYVEKNHNKQFMITIFDIQKDKFSLHEFVDQQISLMESQKNTTILFEQVSPENDWALFAVESTDNEISYGEQLLFLKDNRLYMLQYSGDSPQTLSSDQKEDFRFIMDSFEVI